MAYKGAMRTLTINGNTYQVSGDGLTAEVKEALLNCFEHVAWTDEHGQDYVDALEAALYPPANLLSISAVYTQSGTVYDTDTLDSLKPDLVVTANYDDGTSEAVTTYTLSGTLIGGTSTITVSYGGKTTTFTVNVYQPAELVSISAVYTQSGTVYDIDSIDSLKADLVVTAHYDNSTTETVADEDYTLSGTLTTGTSTITVSYDNKTTTFTVSVTEFQVDYTKDALENVSWTDGETYNASTGIAENNANRSRSSKFTVQPACFYNLLPNTSGTWLTLHEWDENDVFIGSFAVQKTNRLSLLSGHKYAISADHNGSSMSGSTMIPVNNSASASSQIVIPLYDHVESMTWVSGMAELSITSLVSDAGITTSNYTTKINKASNKRCYLGVDVTADANINGYTNDPIFSISTWGGSINLKTKVKNLTSLEAVQNYITTNAIEFVIN